MRAPVRADGERVLSFDQAHANAVAQLNAPKGKVNHLTVRQAMELYVEFKRSQGQSVADVMSRGTAHILPILGDLVVSELTAEELRRWLAAMASSRAQVRPKRRSPVSPRAGGRRGDPQTPRHRQPRFDDAEGALESRLR